MIYKTNNNLEAEKILSNLLTAKEDGCLVLFSDVTWLFSGREKDTFSPEKQEELQMRNFPLTYHGGACVIFEGDLSFLKLEHSPSSNFGKMILRIVKDYLLVKGISAQINKNDLLAFFPQDNKWKKVGSWAQGWVERARYTQTGVHFSINSDVELINNLCTKPMVKEPGALSELGITAQELYGVLKDRLE